MLNIKKFVSNLQNSINKAMFKKVFWAGVGSFLYVTIPTAGKSWLKWDMNGWKGALVGAGVPTVIGLGTNKPEMAFGGLVSLMTHLLYTKANGQYIKMFETPIWNFQITESIYGGAVQSNPSVNDYVSRLAGIPTVSGNYQSHTLPSGEKVLINTQLPTAQVNDYVQTLNDYVASLDDYVDLNASSGQLDLARAVEMGAIN